MLDFLQHGDMGDQGGGGKAWADQLRDVALEVEDIIDEYTYLLGSGGRHRFRDFLRKAFGCDPKPGSLPDIAQRLKDAEIKLQHLSTMKERYNININTVGGEASSSRTEAERRQRSVVVASSHLAGEDDVFVAGEDDVFVGMEKTKADLLGWLTDDESQRRLISVWGMGGLGKTTLVTHIFDSQEVKEHFHTRVWVTVSKRYTVEDLLRRILSVLINAAPNIDSMSFTSLAATVRGYLQDKRYLLVLDDVWSTEDWKMVLKYASPVATDCGSRVILTTREHDVACLGIDHVIELSPLNENEAWELFCIKAFYSTGCPPNLERLAKAILDKCAGLPLAIVALGSLLSLREEEELEWQRVYEDLNWQLNNSPLLQRLKTILLLSIRDLPSHLKNCFLYSSVFPEDYSIPTNKLIRLWVGEGLVQSRGGLTMEDVGEENIKDLVKRTMLQVVQRNYYGRVKYCRLHDMLREVALQICAEEKFCSIHDKPAEERLYITRARRLSVHKCTQEITDGMIGRLRSFLLFDKSISTDFLWTRTQVFSGLKLLRVLDLEGASFDSVPEQVYCLFNLHYLSLKNTLITELSESVAKLRNLQVLNLNRTNVTELPRGITKLKMLRELKVFRYWSFLDFLHKYFYYSGTKSPRGLWVLKELRKLQMVEASDELVRHVGDLVKLRSFRIVKVKAAQCEELCVALSKMVQLRKLNITASGEEEMLHLDTMSSPPQYLERLFLGGRLQNDALPHWFHSLRNLKMLFLHWTKLREDPLPLLHEALPSLVFLQLSRAYEGRELCFRAEAGFPKLESLWLINMPFSRIKIEEGALGGLGGLTLVTCPELKMVPEGIEHLTALWELKLVRMASELEERIRSDPDTIEKIKRIPSIVFQYGDYALEVKRPSIAFQYRYYGGGKFNG